MNEATCIFSEILMQIANVALQSGSFLLMAGAAGAVLDCLTCGILVSAQDKESIKNRTSISF